MKERSRQLSQCQLAPARTWAREDREDALPDLRILALLLKAAGDPDVLQVRTVLARFTQGT